jgi:tetratricopeptide (TPR) repeat protein
MADIRGKGEATRARRRRKAPEAPTTPDAVEIAMERVAGGEPADGPAHAVLRGHRDLVRWQTVSERMSVALKALTGLAGLLVAGALIGLVWDAARYQGLTVQALAVPPDLTARGLTGEVMAGDLLDRLVAMQEQTDSLRAPGSYAIDWGDSTEVEIPQTGVSIGELQRSLRSWLGKETRISGVVYRMRDGRLAVTARTAGTAGVTFTGPEDDLDGLMQKAAESVYARTQPYRYTVYLLDAGRAEEALPLYQAADSYGEPESLWLTRGWGMQKALDGDMRGALVLYRQVQARAPDMGPLFQTIADAEEGLGHAEAAYQARVTAGRLIERSRDLDPAQRTAYGLDQRIQAAFGTRDLGRVETLVEQAGPMPGDLTFPGNRIYLYIGSHRLARAASLLDTLEADTSRSDLISIHFARANLALERADPQEALRRAEQAGALATLNDAPQAWIGVVLGPTRVSALVGLGRVAEARGLAASLPRDCHPCVLARAEAAEAAGRRSEVDLWFAEADRQAPSLPLGPKLWGEALLRRGDASGAILKLAEAHRRGPGWADPLKVWGDALAARGDQRGAVRKYRAAAERAPRWGALRLAWGRALDAEGQRGQAAEQYRAAAGMALSAADRAEVRRRLATDRGPSRP